MTIKGEEEDIYGPIRKTHTHTQPEWIDERME
jgi:hypothetical protein